MKSCFFGGSLIANCSNQIHIISNIHLNINVNCVPFSNIINLFCKPSEKDNCPNIHKHMLVILLQRSTSLSIDTIREQTQTLFLYIYIYIYLYIKTQYINKRKFHTQMYIPSCFSNFPTFLIGRTHKRIQKTRKGMISLSSYRTTDKKVVGKE